MSRKRSPGVPQLRYRRARRRAVILDERQRQRQEEQLLRLVIRRECRQIAEIVDQRSEQARRRA